MSYSSFSVLPPLSYGLKTFQSNARKIFYNLKLFRDKSGIPSPRPDVRGAGHFQSGVLLRKIELGNCTV